MTTKTALDIYTTLSGILKEESESKDKNVFTNGKVRMKVAALLNEVSSIYEAFEQSRVSVIKRLGKIEQDLTYKVDEENVPAFFKEIEDMHNHEVEVKLPVLTLEEAETINMSLLVSSNLIKLGVIKG